MQTASVYGVLMVYDAFSPVTRECLAPAIIIYQHIVTVEERDLMRYHVAEHLLQHIPVAQGVTCIQAQYPLSRSSPDAFIQRIINAVIRFADDAVNTRLVFLQDSRGIVAAATIHNYIFYPAV